MTDRPAFELTPSSNDALPHGKRLTDPDQLVGHEIKAVIHGADGELAHGNELVIVTRTGCWLVLRPEAGYSCEDGADITTVSDRRWHTEKPEQLSDYLLAAEMQQHGLVNAGEYALLKAQEDEREKAKRQRTADQLRAQLAKLEP